MIDISLKDHGRAGLNSTNAPNTEKSLLCWCQTTTHIQIFSNLAKKQSRLEEVTFSDRLCFFVRLLFLDSVLLQGCFFLEGGSELIRWWQRQNLE
jgi:hypothetical protein